MLYQLFPDKSVTPASIERDRLGLAGDSANKSAIAVAGIEAPSAQATVRDA